MEFIKELKLLKINELEKIKRAVDLRITLLRVDYKYSVSLKDSSRTINSISKALSVLLNSRMLIRKELEIRKTNP